MARTILAPQQPATFPTVEPLGPGSIPGGGYERIQAEPASFGGLIGTAEQQAGARLEAGSSALGQAAIQRQDLYNQITADKATTDYMTGVHKQMFGDPAAPEGDSARVGLLGMDGPGAMSAAREMPGKLDQLREQIASTLPNNYVREQFNAETRRQRIYVDQQIGSHYATQMDKWGKQVQDDRIHSAATGAALNYSDPEQLRQNYSTITDAAVKQVTHDIGGPIDPSNPDHQNRLNVALASGYSLFAKNTVDAALAHNQPEVAQKFLQDWEPWLGLPGHIQEELHNSIRAPLEEATVANAVDRAMGRTPPMGGGVGAGGGAPVIPYKAGALLSNTGATQQQYDTFRHTLGNHESSRYDEPPNPQGYMGRYQMNMKDIRESAARLGIAAPTQQEFLKDPELQEKLFEAYEDTGHEEMKDNPIYANASPGQKLALLSAWHLTGGPHLNEYLSTGKEYADANGTTPSKYIKSISNALGVQPPLYGVRVASATPTTMTDATVGAPPAGGRPLDPAAIKALKDGGMSDEEIARVQAASSPAAPATPAAATAAPAPTVAPPPAIPAQPLSAGQQALATGKPDYPSAIARLEQDTSLTPVDRRRAIAAIRQEMSIDYEIEDRNNRLADKQLRDQQAANEGQLFAKAVRKEPLDQATLAKMLEQRQITPAGYNAIIAEANRPEEGQDNADTVLHLYQRIGNNEDVSQDIYNASQAHAIKGTTAVELMKAVDARKKQVADQTERTAFSTLRTIAGMDAAEHPMIDLGREAQQAQVALWGQAQLEWNQRVVVNKEDPMAVLSDMKERYSHPVLSLESLPRPLSGPIRKVEDIAPRAQQLQDAYDRGEVSKDVFDRERKLILQYQDVLDDQNKRQAAKNSVPPVSGGGGARAVGGLKPTGTE